MAASLRDHQARAIAVVFDQLTMIHDQEIPELLRWLDPDQDGAQADARARIGEAGNHLDRAITSIEEAERQLEPLASEGGRGETPGTSTPSSPSDNPYRPMAQGRRRIGEAFPWPVTHWRITSIPDGRNVHCEINVLLTVDTTAPSVIERIESAAAAAGVELEREEAIRG